MNHVLNETAKLKAGLYAGLLMKNTEQLTDSEVDLIEILAQDHEVQSLLETDPERELKNFAWAFQQIKEGKPVTGPITVGGFPVKFVDEEGNDQTPWKEGK